MDEWHYYPIYQVLQVGACVLAEINVTTTHVAWIAMNAERSRVGEYDGCT